MTDNTRTPGSRVEREHFIGDEIDNALRLLNEENDDWQLRGRAATNVDFTVELHGRNYINVKIEDSDDGWVDP